MTRLVLIRHGEAQTAVDEIVGGHEGCTGLSDLGRRQAAALRKRLDATGELAGATTLYASVLPRAIETAEIIAPALGDLDVVQDCDLCEIHAGEADGITWEQWRERHWVEDWDAHTPMAPDGESWAQMMVRVGARLQRMVIEQPGELVVIACHGGVVEGSLVHGLQLPISRRRYFAVTNTSLTEWEHRPGEEWQLVRYNDHAHLADL